MTRREFGLGVQTDRSAADYRGRARLAEDLGFDVISAYGDLMFQPPLYPLLQMAAVTERIRLGPACLNPHTLHPVEIAGQVAALDAASGGRAFLGLARGAWLESIGVEQRRPVAVVREAVEVVRRLLRRDSSGFRGEVFSLAPGLELRYAPARPEVPLLIGAWGEQMAAYAGAEADELKVGGTANPDMLRLARERLARGAERAGRDPNEPGIVAGAVTVVDEDGAAARRRASTEVAMYLAVVAELDPTVELPSDLLRAVRGRLDAGDHEGAGALIPPNVLTRFTMAGTPRDVAEQAEQLLTAGARRVEFGSPHGLTPERGIELLGTQVLPRLRGPEHGRLKEERNEVSA